MINTAFDYGSDFVKFIEFFGIPENSGEFTVIVVVCVCGSSMNSIAAWIITVTYIFAVNHMNLRASPLDTSAAAFFLGNTAAFHNEAFIIGTYRITVFIVTDRRQKAFIAWV